MRQVRQVTAQGGTSIEMPQLYNRAEPLNIRAPDSVTIIGVGGVGSWVAWYLAIAGCRVINIIDPDKIEEHNLGRTPFKSWSVDQSKVEALAEIIYESRPMATVNMFSKKWEELTRDERQLVTGVSDILDCRDSVTPLEGVYCPITGGYDGTNVTIHVAPNLENIWGDGPVHYTVTPSYFGAPAMIALIIVNYLCLERHSRGGRLGELTFDFDMKKIVRKLAGKRRYQAAPVKEDPLPVGVATSESAADGTVTIRPLREENGVFSIYTTDPEVFEAVDDDDMMVDYHEQEDVPAPGEDETAEEHMEEHFNDPSDDEEGDFFDEPDPW